MKNKRIRIGIFVLSIILIAKFSLLSASATELIQNAGFETFPYAPWVSTNSTAGWWSINLPSGAHLGNRYVYLGVGSDGVTTANNVEDIFYQSVAIPSGTTSSSLTFWLKITTDDVSGISHDTLTVEVRNTANTLLQTLASYSNTSANNAYIQQSMSIAGFAGQTIRIAFHGKTDASLKTVFRIDDVSLQPAVSCSYSLNSYSASPNSGSGSSSFTVTTSGSCTWSAISDATSWLHTSSGTTGNGTVSYTYDTNPNAASRTGHITVQDQTFTVTQAGSTVVDYPSAVWMGPAATGNYESGRNGNSKNYIIIHTTEGSMASALSRFQTAGQQASSHYIVGTNGTVWQIVRDADTAYHCGNLTYNYQSIGIEQEGWADGNPDFSWQTTAQRTALESLINWLHTQYGIPLDRAHIIGHNQVPSPGSPYPPTTEWGGASNHHDPGAWFNWRRVMTDLGVAPVFNAIAVQSAASITTLPQSGAPIIVPASPGQKFVAYDYYNGYYLVFLSGYEVAQTGLASGEYHWDGWIPAANVTLDNSLTQLEVTNSFPLRWVIHNSPLLAAATVGKTIDGKRYVATGNTAFADGYTWREFYIATTANTVATGWAVSDAFIVITPQLGGGSWTPLVNSAPGPVNLMLLLTDGTVMAAENDDSSTFYNNWYRLTPDIHGSYVNGTWTTLRSMNYSRLFYSSQMLTNGQIFVAGGEYGTGAATSEIYDPVANSWTQVSVPASLLNPANNSPNGNVAQGFIDSESKLLPNGNVLLAPVRPSTSNGTLIFNPVANTWSSGPATLHWQAEAGWVKLPDGSLLTVDPDNTTSERYIPSSNQWIGDAAAPVSLYVPLQGGGKTYVGETGPALLLPNGKAFFIGGAGHTALYTPSGSIAPGSWVAGPDIPGGLVAADAPAAMMVNGKVLCAVAQVPYVDGSGNPQFPTSTSFYEYDPVANSFTQVNGPTGPIDNFASFQTVMLNLPDGSVLYSHFGSSLYSYQPVGSQLPAGKPTISSITQNADGSYHLIGTLLNGISQGAAYGDDEQMDGNYPLVRVTNSIGNVYYERTYNWSSTAVMTGNTPVTTEFANSAALPPGTYSLVVVANGISSDPFSFTVPSPKSNQTVSFAPLANKTFGELPFSVSATASSGLSVGFSILSGPATISGNNVTLASTGTVVVRASQGGNASYNAAPNVDQPFTIYAPPQTSVTLSGNKFIISWPTNVAGFVLQITPSLNPASWSTVSPSPVIVNGQFTVTNNAASGNMFYRLQK